MFYLVAATILTKMGCSVVTSKVISTVVPDSVSHVSTTLPELSNIPEVGALTATTSASFELTVIESAIVVRVFQ